MICRYCGTQNEDDAIFCGQCGYQLVDEETIVHSQSNTRDTLAPTIHAPKRSKRRNLKVLLDEYLERVLDEIEEEIQRNPYNVDARFEKVKTLSQLGWYEQLLRAIDELLQLDPTKYAETLSYRGDALYEVGRHEEALLLLDGVLQLNPHDTNTHFTKTQILYKMERYTEALSSIDEVLRLQPDSDIALNFREEIVQFLGRPGG